MFKVVNQSILEQYQIVIILEQHRYKGDAKGGVFVINYSVMNRNISLPATQQRDTHLKKQAITVANVYIPPSSSFKSGNRSNISQPLQLQDTASSSAT